MDDDLRLKEKDKYERIWALKSYRKNSPGLNHAHLLMNKFPVKPGQSVMDYGCGEFLAVDYFRKQGLQAYGTDIVKLHPEIIEACLWDMGTEVPETDWGYSCDVMEHIPPEKVDAVLRGIHNRVRLGAFICLSVEPDVHGAKIGETLHLTVQPYKWWLEKLRALYTHVEVFNGDKKWRFCYVCRK